MFAAFFATGRRGAVRYVRFALSGSDAAAMQFRCQRAAEIRVFTYIHTRCTSSLLPLLLLALTFSLLLCAFFSTQALLCFAFILRTALLLFLGERRKLLIVGCSWGYSCNIVACCFVHCRVKSCIVVDRCILQLEEQQ